MAEPVQIPVKRSINARQWVSHPRKGAGNGATKKAPRPLLPLAVAKDLKDAAQAATRDNQRVLLLEHGRHRRFVRASAP